ncbi:hypothetical protein CHS0354_008723 [Potamilus streckersoni]|uniref:Calmodulin-lysine N-methyltransferase n=1 Tax=Potamilus streckersoni TaxID=2493646 RepID=A0AAE0SBN9_9BIVA|nr:hypothetical protein CHS0354_008723 [Potamilus streckersoni]
MSCTESSKKLSTKSHAIDKRKNISMQRWRILKEVLLGRKSSETCQHSASVRRFKGFGLLTTQKLSYIESDSFGEWYEYTMKDIPDFRMTIRQLPGVITPESLRGFNNTGNVCVWPAEEVMAYFCLQHTDWFSGKTVCELGGGMTCLAGVALSVATDVSYVELSDGNEESVSNLKEIIKKNMENDLVDKTKLSASPKALSFFHQQILSKTRPGTIHYSLMLCVLLHPVHLYRQTISLFFDEGRGDLVRTIESLLKPEVCICLLW